MTETEGTEAAPIALFRHSISVYEEMEVQAKVIVAGSEGSEMLVYEGSLTDLVINDVGLPVPYYTRVTKFLKASGCARQLRRGGGTSGSQWELITKPTLELFNEYQGKQSPDDDIEYATQQSFNDLNKRVQRLEKALGV